MMKTGLLIFLLLGLMPVAAWPDSPPGEAGFTVEYRSANGFPRQLSIELVCSAGITESIGAELAPRRPQRLVFAGFQSAEARCRIRAHLPDGYGAAYAARGDSESSGDATGCSYERVTPGQQARCLIEVTQQPVTVTVYKKWIGGSGPGKAVRVSLDCESGAYTGDRFINEGEPDGWEIRDIDPDGVLCNVYEEESDDFRPDIIDCQGLYIVPGRGEECTMVNTRIVKRIEMLNRYGIVVMILLVLVVGLLAMKRLY